MFKIHSQKQQDAIYSESPITVLGTGIQWGKTVSGALWLKTLIHKHPLKTSNFIVTAPTYKVLEQSSLPAFQQIMEGMGTLNATKMVFKVHNGPSVYFRTNKEPDSIVGLTNVRGIWGDEAGKYTLYFWQNIQGRASFKSAPIMLTTSPYALNWIWSDVIKPAKRGQRSDVKVIQAASWENPYHPFHDVHKREEQRANMDPRRFEMMYGGEWHRMSGLVYDCWEDSENLVQPFQLPVGTRYYGGIDWGFTDPFALKIRAVTPDNRHYGISEFYKPGMTIKDIAELCHQKMSIFHITTFWCDPSQPGHIEQLNREGIPAAPAENDIRRGIDLHYSLIKERRYKEFAGYCPASADERENYHYPEPKDLGPDQNAKEALPVDQSNHLMDTDRYITLMTYRVDRKLNPGMPGEKKIKTRLDQLKYSYLRKEWEE